MYLKLETSPNLPAEKKELVDSLYDGNNHFVKLSTNSLEYDKDRKDERYISAIRNVKMIFKLKESGCLILKGKLGCSFKSPFGGSYFIVSANIDESADYNTIIGVEKEIKFDNNYPISIDSMENELGNIIEDKDFLFNMSQFEDFMDVFTFYKTLSNELNNNTTYKIENMSNPYYYVPISVKDIPVDESNQLTNKDGLVVGYKIEEHKYDMLAEELKDEVIQLYDIKINASSQEIKKIRKFSDSMYVSDYYEVDEKNSRQLKDFVLRFINQDEKYLILSGEINSDIKYKYLNLYDMGQKVKVESINNSLRLINQGASGSAMQLIEYLIGDAKMPNHKGQQKVTKAKEKYVQGLDDSQKQAFLMATDGSPVSLIKGPPGTGKTYVINAIVQYITKELGEKVVISSQTHVAIDNVLDEIMQNYDLIIPNRITNRKNKYSGKEIDNTLYQTWAKKFNEHNLRATDRSLSEKIQEDIDNFNGSKKFKYSQEMAEEDYSVLGATTTTSAIGGKKGLELLEGYKWLIIDEVSKCPITEVLRYLPYVEKIIMVGDDFQLAPLLEFTKEEVENLPSYDEDKFERLKGMYENSVFASTLEKARSTGRVVTLNVNYRSVSSVLKAYNIFYDGALINKREFVKPNKVQFADKYFNLLNDKDVFFVDVQYGKEAKEGTSRYNIEELEATASVLKELLENTINPIGVSVSAIFPYAAQIEKFQKNYLNLINKAKTTFKSFEIDTVDAFQGRETDIVLVNTVVTDPSQRNFLNDFRRINVSMSRARDKLFIFGNPNTLSRIDMKTNDGNTRKYFKNIIYDIRKFGGNIQYKGGLSYEFASKSKIEIV